MKVAMPSVTATRVGVITICADLRPSRLAVTVMGPGAGSVVRTSLEADGDAVDAALGVEVRVVGGFELAAVVTAAPDGGAGAGEVDARVVGGATDTLGVDDLEVDEGDVFAVGLEALGAKDGGELDCSGRTGGDQFLLCGDLVTVLADGLDAGRGRRRCRGRRRPHPVSGLELTPADLPLTISSTDSVLAMT